MRTLLDAQFTGLGISVSQSIATVNVTDRHITLMIMITLNNLGGDGGDYTVNLAIDSNTVTPVRAIPIDAGLTSIILQSRDVVLYQNGHLEISLLGQLTDTNVDGRVLMLETTAITAQEVQIAVESGTANIVSAVSNAVAQITINVSEQTKVLGPAPTCPTINNAKYGAIAEVPVTAKFRKPQRPC